MRLIHLLGALIAGGAGSAEVARPLAGLIEVEGASWVAIWPEAQIVGEGNVGDWFGVRVDEGGVVRFRVDPHTDYTLTVNTGHGETWAQERVTLPVTRAHRVEIAVRMRVEAEERLRAESATMFEINAVLGRITAERGATWP